MIFTLAFIFAGVPAFAQYEDLANLPEAPTRVGNQEEITCALEGVQIIKKPGGNGSKDVSVVFLLTRKPSVYFNYYDAARKAVVFDFYDTHIGESILDTIREPPITTSSVESYKIDLNRDVEGFKPDIRDVVRVALFTPYVLDYDVQEDGGVITLSFKWSGRKENRLKRQKTAFYWQFPLALAAAGGAGFAAYELWLKKSTVERINPFTALPSHPE
jgi:hypothetical protein